ncbi:hypothetical protein JJB07_19300 [Tumebacillus sp. ITR2]|uniref:Uncharacterized protein n=1 Tax=Tumebacillus amylolyticus TaxID=2801339 RepID=A0ABS1JEN3_9BACL|nr:hypothetical protein [Tumebacillus amylolyticus]MBL0388751.1 hypothetical protein [Tumebacillus amylolyticus]
MKTLLGNELGAHSLFEELKTQGYVVRGMTGTARVQDFFHEQVDIWCDSLQELFARSEHPTVSWLHVTDEATTELQQKLLQHLQPLWDDTLIICVGETNQREDGTMEDRVPLVFSYPTRFTGARAVSKQVRLADVVPTVLDLLNLPYQHEDFTAQSLLPAFRGEQLPFLPAVTRQEQTHALRLQLENETLKVYWDADQQRFEVYNLTRDPLEKTNLFR